MTLQQITEAALNLTEEERAELAYQLLQSFNTSLDEDSSDEWAEVIQRRIKQIDDGEVQLIPGDVVRKKALALLR